jgi:DNA mismatch repair protein MutL
MLGDTGRLLLLGEAAAAHEAASPPDAEAVSLRSAGLSVAPAAATPGAETRRLLRGPFRLVGQALESYIVAEGPSGLVLVDQHAAHERILANALAARIDRGASLQPLLIPQVVRLTPAQHACLGEHLDDLRRAGLEVEDFGPGAARVVAHDPLLPARRLSGLVLAMLDTLLGESREEDLARRLDRAIHTLACHAAVKFGQRLSPVEMEALLRELEVADPGITCPHGRPTLLEIGERELRREFRRP